MKPIEGEGQIQSQMNTASLGFYRVVYLKIKCSTSFFTINFDFDISSKTQISPPTKVLLPLYKDPTG